VALKTEQSFRLQMIIAVLIVVAAALLRIRAAEWIIVLLVMGSVLVLELLNSVLERIMDAFKPRLHPVVHDMKDIMAAVVLIASLFSVAIGLVIFWPYLTRLF
jgi:diacylglycerol kinase